MLIDREFDETVLSNIRKIVFYEITQNIHLFECECLKLDLYANIIKMAFRILRENYFTPERFEWRKLIKFSQFSDARVSDFKAPLFQTLKLDVFKIRTQRNN